MGLGVITPPQVVYAGEKPIVVLESPHEEPEPISEEERCNCYLFVKNRVDVPRMVDIAPNSDISVGSVAIFVYPNGLKHVAIVKEVWGDEFLVEETNYKNCTHKNRLVDYDNSALIGFYSPVL